MSISEAEFRAKARSWLMREPELAAVPRPRRALPSLFLAAAVLAATDP